jgi:glycosyltransferase involved in cell wall biosynthesis
MAPVQRPTVVVWRNLWLPRSETFVRDHVDGLRRWKPLLLGVSRMADGLPVQPDRAPFPRGRVGAPVARVMSRAGYPFVYDSMIRRSGARLVHAHFGTGAVEVLPVARRLRLPLVVTFHGHDVNRAPRDADGERYLRRLRAVFTYADVLLAVSGFVASRLVELGAPPDKIRVHYLGVPVHHPLPDPFGARSGVTFVGRLTRQKGVDDLLAAYALLPRELRLKEPLTIVGEGPLRAELERDAASLGPESRVEFAGVVDSTRVAELLARSTVFVAPSKRVPEGDAEGFGLTMLEASRAGCPVVGYDDAGVAEAVVNHQTGLLVPLGDVHSLARAVQQVVEDRELACSLGGAGQRRVAEHFDLAARTEALEQIYDQVVGGG